MNNALPFGFGFFTNDNTPLDAKYYRNFNSSVLGAIHEPYNDINDVNLSIISSIRYKGLTVAVKNGPNSIDEYWYRDGILDVNLVLKGSGSGGGGLISITYSDLYNLYNTSALVVGQSYLITDFELDYSVEGTTYPNTLTTTEAGITRVLEPIIVLAVGVNKIGTTAYSTLHREDILEYDFLDNSFSSTSNLANIRKGFIKRRIDTLRKIDIYWDWRYQRFTRSKITSFVGQKTWTPSTAYFKGDIIENSGVFYRCYKDYVSDLTFSYDIDTGFIGDLVHRILDNTIYIACDGHYGIKDTQNSTSYTNYILNAVVYGLQSYFYTFSSNININNPTNNHLSSSIKNISIGHDSTNNIFYGGTTFKNNQIFSTFKYNTIGNGFQQNYIKHQFNHNTITANFRENNIGEDFEGNIIFQGDFRGNSTGKDFQGNYFCVEKTGKNIRTNTFGNEVDSCTFLHGFYNSKSGDVLSYSIFEEEVKHTTFLNFCENIYIKKIQDILSAYWVAAETQYNIFGNSCSNITVGSDSSRNTFGTDSYGYIGKNCSGNTIQDGTYFNIGDDCNDNIIGHHSSVTLIGGCTNSIFPSWSTLNITTPTNRVDYTGNLIDLGTFTNIGNAYSSTYIGENPHPLDTTYLTNKIYQFIPNTSNSDVSTTTIKWDTKLATPLYYFDGNSEIAVPQNFLKAGVLYHIVKRSTYFVIIAGGGGNSGSSESLSQIVAGEDLLAGELVYLNTIDYKWYKADNLIETKINGLIRVVKANILADVTGDAYNLGKVNLYTGLNIGSKYYIGSNGSIIDILPNTEGIFSRFVGVASSNTELEFLLDETYYEMTLNDPSIIKIDESIVSVMAGEALLAGDIIYLNTDNKWYKADNTIESKIKGLIRVAKDNIVMDSLGDAYIFGSVNSYTGLVVGSNYYISTNGSISDTIPNIGGIFSRFIGVASSTTVLEFSDSGNYYEMATIGGGNVIDINVVGFQALLGVYSPSTTYKILDADINLYGGSDGGSEIYLTTNGEGLLNERGLGKFYNPKYDQTVSGFNVWTNLSELNATPTSGTWTPQYPPENITANNGATGKLFTTINGAKFIALTGDWSTATSITGDITGATASILSIVLKSYADGDLVHWGGKTWERDGTVTNGIVGTAIDIYSLSSEWIPILFDSINYNVVYDEIIYDVENDLIVYRNEKNSNIVSINKGYIDSWQWNSIKDFMWGNVLDGINYVGIGMQTITNSYNNNINFRGFSQDSLTFEDGSYQNNLTFENISYQSFLTFTKGGYLESSIFDNSYQIFSRFENNSGQQNLTFNNNSAQQNLTFNNNSAQQNLTFENGSQYNLILNNSSQAELLFKNFSQNSLTFENSSQNNFVLDSYYQSNIKFQNYSRSSFVLSAIENGLDFKGDLQTITTLNSTTDKIYVKQDNQVKEITTIDLQSLIGGGSGGSSISLTTTGLTSVATLISDVLNIPNYSVSGTSNRISITSNVIDISSSYVGQSSITTLGTITSGVWNATPITNTYLVNSSITLGTTNISLGSTITTITGLTSLTSIDFIGSLTGNSSSATILATARNINGVAFNGSSDITITADSNTLTGTTLKNTVVNSSLISVGNLTSGSIGVGFTAIPNTALSLSSGTGFVKANGTSISYDNNVYLDILNNLNDLNDITIAKNNIGFYYSYASLPVTTIPLDTILYELNNTYKCIVAHTKSGSTLTNFTTDFNADNWALVAEGKLFRNIDVSGAVSLDMSLGNAVQLTMVGNITSFTCTNILKGHSYTFKFIRSSANNIIVIGTTGANIMKASYGIQPTILSVASWVSGNIYSTGSIVSNSGSFWKRTNITASYVATNAPSENTFWNQTNLEDIWFGYVDNDSRILINSQNLIEHGNNLGW